MPETCKISNSHLAIVLDGPERPYSPGDTLIGHVIRKQHVVSARGVVTLKLCGRAKTKLEFQSGKQTKVRRSRFALIDERQSRQVLHDGPVHVPQGGGQPLILPFAITIPTHVPPSFPASEPETSFLPLDPESVSQQTLPSTLWAPSDSSSLVAFVEYLLEANISVRSDGLSRGAYDAKLPITVWNYGPNPPIVNFQLKKTKHLHTVSTQRLVPGMENAELSTKDKMKKFFRTSSVLSFSFRLEVGIPSVMQLDNPNPIPFTVRAIPDWKMTEEIIQGVPQKIILRSLRTSLKVLTMARADGTFSPYDKDTDVDIDLMTDRAFSPLKRTVYVPCTDEWPALDVGSEINFRIGYDGAAGHQRQYNTFKINPTTETYNIRLTYMLMWEVKLEIASEERKIKGGQPVLILPSTDPREEEDYTAPPPLEELRSDSWIQPPAEGDAPPTFTQVQKEDMMRNEGKVDKDDGLGTEQQGEGSRAQS